MKRLFFVFLVAILIGFLYGCSSIPSSSYALDTVPLSTSDYEDLYALISMWADDPEAEANFVISDLCIDDSNVALSTLRSFINGNYVSKKKALDSVTYLERYIRSLENLFDDLEDIIE